MEVTTKEIARICGISRGTVDRALNNRSGVSGKTREKVLRVAKELGYRPHLLARSLVKGRSMILGLILFDLNHRFFAQLLSAVEAEAKSEGYFIFPVLTAKNPDEEKAAIERLVALNVDGIILFSVSKGREYDQYLKSLHKPIVTIGNRISKNWPFVGIDDKQAVKDAIEIIINRGYRRIIYVSPPLANTEGLNNYEVERRYEGFREAMDAAVPEVSAEIIKARDYISAVLQTEIPGSKKTAIFCTSDIYALRLIKKLKSMGIMIPQNIGVMGFDNIDILEFAEPKLTTIDYHINEMGTLAVQFLLRVINGAREDMTAFIPHNIIEGHSL